MKRKFADGKLLGGKLLWGKLFGACLLAAAGTSAMAADTWPSRPITFVLPYQAGGGGDTAARALAEDMSKALGKPIIVENRPGASGIIGTNAVAKAQPDGYTVLLTLTQSVLNNRFLYSQLPYDPTKDLAFVTEVATGTILLTVSTTAPVHSVKELIDWGRKNKLSAGNWGVGSYGHLTSTYLGKTKKIDIVNVSYKGEAPMLQDLAGGSINFAFSSLNSTRPFLQSGKVRVLAVSGRHRLAALPDVPTLAEAGLAEPEYAVTGTMLMMVPAATPAPIVARLEKEARTVINSTRYRARLQVLGLEPLGEGAKQARVNYDAQFPVQQRLVQLSGAKLD